jgi:hypothetical protein
MSSTSTWNRESRSESDSEFESTLNSLSPSRVTVITVAGVAGLPLTVKLGEVEIQVTPTLTRLSSTRSPSHEPVRVTGTARLRPPATGGLEANSEPG